jgi:hypothetical protein
MVLSLIALAITVASLLLILGGLRGVARDTLEMLSLATRRAHGSGALASRVSFLMLWAMIFALAYA